VKIGVYAYGLNPSFLGGIYFILESPVSLLVVIPE
jgi:hypothetical protein